MVAALREREGVEVHVLTSGWADQLAGVEAQQSHQESGVSWQAEILPGPGRSHTDLNQTQRFVTIAVLTALN